MTGIQRYDLEGGATLTERELRRRWATFHGSIRIRSGKPIQQFIGRMLGENTVRYKIARIVGRPILKLAKALKGQRHVPMERSVEAVAPSFFPLNYRPRDTPLVDDGSERDPRLDDVEVVEMARTVASADELARINATVTATTRTWLFLCDAAASPRDRTETLSVLVGAAREEDDVVFADEAGPNPRTPILKSPGVGPHTLLSYNLVGRPALLRASTLRAIGGISEAGGAAFEHDLYLRLSERRARFHHVATVLGCGRPSDAFSAEVINDDSARVVEAALERRGWRGSVSTGDVPGLVRWVPAVPTPAPSIDVIIPTRDRLDLVRQCVEAIESKTTYPNYRIVFLDNDSKEEATLEYFATTSYRVIPCPGPFNYAHIVNRGVSHSDAQYVVTLNNDTVLITPDWLERMVGLAALPDVGFVGGCLVDPDGRSEHESIVISPYPQHLRSDSNYPHADLFIAATRDVAAVTGAVQMVERAFWESLGGMDERLRVTMNDVDICLRSQLEGRHVVYTPDVRLYHNVSSSRGKLDPLEDRNLFIRRWDIFGQFQDPYFPESILLLGERMFYRYR